MNHLGQLLSIYTKHPCRTLPNAFWKTAARLEQSHVTITIDTFGELSSLVIWEDERLMAFWCADPADHPLTEEEIARVPFALVHAAALPVFAQRNFARRQPYFRLVHLGSAHAYPCPAGYAIELVSPETDLDEVVGLLSACYPGFNISPEIVQAWLSHPVYDPELWLWVVDLERGGKAGLGIAERDPLVGEASLEWIQVLPAYRGRGLGKAIVTELVRRTSAEVKFTTVAGEAMNAHQPEKLYRQCGFTGKDVWWLLTDGG